MAGGLHSTATSISYAERNGRHGLGRMLTDWNAETVLMAENSFSDVTLNNSFTILLSQWRVPAGPIGRAV